LNHRSHDDADERVRAVERYQAFIDRSSEGIWRLEFNPPIDITLPVEVQVALAYERGRIAEGNDAMARMHGLEGADDLIGRPLDFILPSSDSWARAYLASIVGDGYRATDVESAEPDTQGRIRHFLKSIAGVVRDGHLHSLWGLERDISERKLLEADRRGADERFRLMADALPILLWVTGPDRRSRWFNQSYLTFVGRSLEQELADGWMRHVHPRDLRLVLDVTDAAVARREPFTIEYRMLRAGGDYREMLANGVPVTTSSGVFDGYIGTCLDVTEQKRATAAQAYLAAIVESADDAIISKDLDGVIQSCNAAAERLFGYSSAELVGRSVRMLIPPDRQSEEDLILGRLRRGQPIEHFETVRLAKGGRPLDISLTVSPVRDTSGRIIGASKVAREIGERKQAAAAQAYLAALVASSDDAIIGKDLNGFIQSCNASAERMFGYTAAELIGRSVRILIPPDRQHEEDEILARMRRGERIEHFETVRMKKTGELLDISLTVSPVRDASGAIIGVSKIARDITAQKRAAIALATQQAWFRVTLASIGDAVIASDPNGRVTFMNTTAERLTGWTQRDAQDRPLQQVFKVINEKSREPIDNPALLVMRLGTVVGLANHTVLVARDGTERPIADSAAPIRDRAGKVLGVVLVFRDVTDERRAEDAIAEQREWLETTLESIGDAVIATDVQGRIVFMNPVAEHMTGWRADAANGRACSDVFRIVNEQSRRPVDDPVSRVLSEGSVVAFGTYTVLISADGTERPIDESGAPIRNRDGRTVGVVLVFRDVSERRRLELDRQSAAAERDRLLEAERAARAEAERASRVKDEFVAMVSHELRTPLNAILGWTQLMMRGQQDRGVFDRGLDVIARNTRLQAQLISDLLDISRIVSGKLQLDVQSVDLHGLISEAVETIRPEAKAKNLTIHETLDPDAGVVAGDSARLQQIVWNLLANALKFTPAGGRIEVGVRRVDGNAEITVVDNGVGIKADVLPYVFDRFHQADRSITRRFGGLGLGLAIVKHLTELHGGAVRAESAGEGRGATFTVSLPTSAAAAGAGERQSPETEASLSVSLEGLRVLVVEDEQDTREFLERLLEGQGATVTSAVSAEQALQSFEADPPDIVISDIGLPQVDGYELIQHIRRGHIAAAARVPAIALTAYARSEDRNRALRAGYQAHIAKPVEPADLLVTIASFRGLIDAGSEGI
jgi:PAS domain S-box-containing protein